MSLFVEPDVLWAEARALAAASNRADELAGSVPSSVDGGVGTAAILGILSVFAESGGELVSGLRGMSDVLIECADRYADQDIATADSINNSVWVSTAEVASSRMRMGASESKARAIARRCF